MDVGVHLFSMLKLDLQDKITSLLIWSEKIFKSFTDGLGLDGVKHGSLQIGDWKKQFFEMMGVEGKYNKYFAPIFRKISRGRKLFILLSSRW